METVICIVIGLVAGIAGGLFGIGGGIIIIPALVLTLGFTQKKAQGTSLVALLAPVGILGLMNYYRENQVDLAKGAYIALGFLVGAFFGSKIAVGLQDDLMRRLFSVFLIAVGVYMFFKK